ncbi:MAG: hypothetical protein VR64_20570 [Desulfatitalea sp. BRH_c12]|nr:MAG: hypothetical protein VR64_20570 [Desulfatitalea sp. BRH_c12]
MKKRLSILLLTISLICMAAQADTVFLINAYQFGGEPPTGQSVCAGNWSTDCAETSYPSGSSFSILSSQYVTVVDCFTASEAGTANRIRWYFGTSNDTNATNVAKAVFYVNRVQVAEAGISPAASSWVWSDGDLNAAFSPGDEICYGGTLQGGSFIFPRSTGGSTFEYLRTDGPDASGYDMADISTGLEVSSYKYGFILEYTR